MGLISRPRGNAATRDVPEEPAPRDTAALTENEELRRQLAAERALRRQREAELDEERAGAVETERRLRRKLECLWSAYSMVSMELDRERRELELRSAPRWRRRGLRKQMPGRDGTKSASRRARGRIARVFCLVAGLGLIAAGGLGFVLGDADDFSTGPALHGETVGGFVINGWHAVTYAATGALLFLCAIRPAVATAGALLVGAVYAGGAAWGFIDGYDIAGVFPTNMADNYLHAAVSGTAILAAVLSLGFARLGRRPAPVEQPAQSPPTGGVDLRPAPSS
jgi:Domain of unknown function (DUF4383)